MTRPPVLLLDFFGTLVDYQPDLSGLAYVDAHQFAVGLGFVGDHDGFVMHWHRASMRLEAASVESGREYSMLDSADAFARSVGLDAGHDHLAELAARFLVDWRGHVRPVDGVPAMLDRLAGSYRLGVVSNTHDPDMVPSMLAAMGVDHLMSTVVLSVDHGWRKPHESIYRAALDQLGCAPADVVFVGDSMEPDYAAPRRAGMSALLIDPTGEQPIDAPHRLQAITDLEHALRRR